MEYVSLYPSQYRVLNAIYFNPNITVNELIDKSKTAYPPDSIQALRHKGIEINSEYTNNPNTLSNRKIVKYSILPSSRQLALYSLKNHKDKN